MTNGDVLGYGHLSEGGASKGRNSSAKPTRLGSRSSKTGSGVSLQNGSLFRLPGETEFVRIAMVDDSGATLSMMVGEPGAFRMVALDAVEASKIEALTADIRRHPSTCSPASGRNGWDHQLRTPRAPP